jgi:hypothetical protein
MTLEYRFVLVDFTYRDSTGRTRVFTAGRPYPMPQAVADAATKHGLVSKSRPRSWVPPDALSPIMTLTEDEIAKAKAERQGLTRDTLLRLR